MSMQTPAEIIASKHAVIFDLFHTLTSLEWSQGTAQPLTHQLLGVPREAWNEQLFFRSRDRLVGRQTDAVDIVTDMARAIDPAITDEVIAAAVENRIARFADALAAIPPATQAVLAELKARGKRIGLLSNADVMEVAAWSASPIAGAFDSELFSCHAGCCKPEPEIYRLSLEQLGVSSSEAVFVGDGGSNELSGARDVGLTTIMMSGVIRHLWPEQIPQRRRHADAEVACLDELLA